MAGPGGAKVVNLQKNLLAQQLNFSPGTSLAGSFGTTDSRFKLEPSGGDSPGPGSYQPLQRQVYTSAARWSWGTGAGHDVQHAPGGRTPGPGAYGTQQHPCGILTSLRRQWPGIASKSAFGSNAERPLGKTTVSDVPGPGMYNTEEAGYFVSGVGSTGARSPFLAQARARTGSRLQRDMDLKLGAVFSSRLPAHKMADNGSGAATDAPRDYPGPGAHFPVTDTIAARHERQLRQLHLRSDGGVRTSFDTTASRFEQAAGSAPEPHNPGPGAHFVSRWSGDQPTTRRPQPRQAPTMSSAGKCAFLSSTDRFASEGRRACSSNAVVQYLAEGPQRIGQPTHAQRAIGQVRASKAGPR